MSNQPIRSIAAVAILLAALCTLSIASLAPVASARPTPSAGAAAVSNAHALARQQRREARALVRQQRRDAREAKRAARRSARLARQAERAARRAEREERHATRAAERASRSEQQGTSGEQPGGDQPPAPSGGPVNGGEASPGGESTSAGNRAAQRDCTITLTPSAPAVAPGEAVVLSGTLSCPTAQDAGEQTITIYAHQLGEGSAGPTVAGSATTAADGTFQFQTAPVSVRTTFLAQAAGARQHGRAVVLVAAQVTLEGPAPSGATLAMGAGRDTGGPAFHRFSGTILPEQADRQVALKVRDAGGQWHTIAYTRTDATGHFSFLHQFKFAGEVSVKATARPHGAQRGESQTLSYSVAQAQNAKLTIQLATTPPATPPSAPLSGALGTPGSTAAPSVISGVAGGSPRRTVTLLSRGQDGRYTAVSSVESDAAGAYSFTVDPTVTTIYKVVCRPQRSATVRVEVSPVAPTS